MINAKKIAELAQVSRSTVQRALANNPNIAPETKDRILEIAASMEYRPNRHAKALVMRQQKLTYGVVFSVSENRFYQEVLKGIYQARDEIKDFGVQIDVQFMETIDGCRQAELLNRMVAENRRGIAFVGYDCPEVREAVDEGVQRGVSFVTMVSDIGQSKRLCFVGQDLYRSGMAAGGLMKLLVPNGEKIACIVGSKQFLAHRERLNGFKERFLKGRPEDSIVAVLENDDSSKKSVEIMSELLGSVPRLKGVFIAGAGVEGVCRVVQERGLGGKLKIISYDLVQSREFCRQGVIDFVIDQDPFEEGYRALTVLNSYIMFGEKPEDRMLTKVDIRTIDTVDL